MLVSMLIVMAHITGVSLGLQNTNIIVSLLFSLYFDEAIHKLY